MRYTIEAAIIIPLFLLVFGVSLNLLFYHHDKNVIGAAAYPTFLDPGKIAPGGLTGVAMILKHLWGWDIGITSLILNIPLFIVGYRTMGRLFAFRSLVATILFSLAISASAATVPPRKSEPVSPIKTLAGWKLYTRKPRRPPTSAAA